VTENNPSKPSAIAYARYSPRPNDDDSCIKQHADIAKWAESNGILIRACFSDEQISGGQEPDEIKRAGLWRALQALKPGETLVVRDLARAARGHFVTAMIEKALKEKNCKLRSIRGQGTEGESPQDKLMRRIHEAFAEYEREMIAMVTSEKMKIHQSNGRAMGGRPPFGYDKVEGQLIENNQEQEVIDYIGSLREKYGVETVVSILNRHGVPCRGSKWHPNTIRRLEKRDPIDV